MERTLPETVSLDGAVGKLFFDIDPALPRKILGKDWQTGIV